MKVTASLGVAFLLGQAYVWQRLHIIAGANGQSNLSIIIMMLVDTLYICLAGYQCCSTWPSLGMC